MTSTLAQRFLTILPFAYLHVYPFLILIFCHHKLVLQKVKWLLACWIPGPDMNSGIGYFNTTICNSFSYVELLPSNPTPADLKSMGSALQLVVKRATYKVTRGFGCRRGGGERGVGRPSFNSSGLSTCLWQVEQWLRAKFKSFSEQRFENSSSSTLALRP